MEGLRRGNEMQLGQGKVYGFGNQSAIEKMAIQQLPLGEREALESQLSSGRYPVAPEDNPKGYYWRNDEEGIWANYDTRG
jgi:hypothetical protein